MTQQASDEINELYAELMAGLWKKLRDAIEKNKEVDQDEVIKDFKEENADKIEEVKEHFPDGISKDYIFNQAIQNINEYSSRFNESNLQSNDLIQDLKDRVDTSTKEGEELLEGLTKLESNNAKEAEDKDQLLDQLINKYNERTPSKDSIEDHLKKDYSNLEHIRTIEDKNNNPVSFYRDKDKGYIETNIDEKNRQVIVSSVSPENSDDEKDKSNSIKYPFKDINQDKQKLTKEQYSITQLHNTHVEHKGTWFKKETMNKKEHSKETKGELDKQKTNENTKEIENKRQPTKEKEPELE